MMLTDLLALSHVPRWTIVPLSRPQSVAEHCHRTGVIYLELCRRLSVTPTLEGLRWALTHDGPEARSGDIPAPFKTAPLVGLAEAERQWCSWYGALKPGAVDAELVALADHIEAATFIRQYGIGPHAEMCANNLHRRLMDTAPLTAPTPVVKSIMEDIRNEAGRFKPYL